VGEPGELDPSDVLLVGADADGPEHDMADAVAGDVLGLGELECRTCFATRPAPVWFFLLGDDFVPLQCQIYSARSGMRENFNGELL
jgi:hypothetical protein